MATLAPAGIDALVLKLACLSGGLVHAALPPFPFRDGVESEATKPFLDAAQPRLIVAPSGHPAIEGMSAVSLGELVRDSMVGAVPGADEDAAPEDWAAIFFTSGSTGTPRACRSRGV